jgi:hypothetical protein
MLYIVSIWVPLGVKDYQYNHLEVLFIKHSPRIHSATVENLIHFSMDKNQFSLLSVVKSTWSNPHVMFTMVYFCEFSVQRDLF